MRERRIGGKTVGSISESYQQVANLTLKEGRLPQEENEILLVDPENWDYQVGDQVRISYEFSYIFKQAGEVTHSLQDALVRGTESKPGVLFAIWLRNCGIPSSSLTAAHLRFLPICCTP